MTAKITSLYALNTELNLTGLIHDNKEHLFVCIPHKCSDEKLFLICCFLLLHFHQHMSLDNYGTLMTFMKLCTPFHLN